MAARKTPSTSTRPSKLLRVLVLGGAVLATSCATKKPGDGAKPTSARPADSSDSSGSGGGVQGW